MCVCNYEKGRPSALRKRLKAQLDSKREREEKKSLCARGFGFASFLFPLITAAAASCHFIYRCWACQISAGHVVSHLSPFPFTGWWCHVFLPLLRPSQNYNPLSHHKTMRERERTSNERRRKKCFLDGSHSVAQFRCVALSFHVTELARHQFTLPSALSSFFIAAVLPLLLRKAF